MDHRPYLEIWKGAYLSTLQRFEALCHRMRGDLSVHGVTLSVDRALEVAARLRATETPTLHDFYPDGRIELAQPPLCLEVRRGEDPPDLRAYPPDRSALDGRYGQGDTHEGQGDLPLYK